MRYESRSSLNKEKVKTARQTLLAKQLYPSVDAVRIELGNTGSKTTIHKYLKELEQEEGGQSTSTISLSETLQNFVAQLAKQLHVEADEKIQCIKTQFEQQQQQDLAQVAQSKERQNTLEDQLQSQEQQLEDLKQQHQQLQQNWQSGQIENSRLTQHIVDLNQQLKQHEHHKAEILDKFNHAQKSLEHYRESVKEQRQQDLRRHDSAVQHLQNEIKQLQQTIIVERHQNTLLQQEHIKQNTQLDQLQQQHQDHLILLNSSQQQLENTQQHYQQTLLQQQQVEQEKHVMHAQLTQQLEQLKGYQNIEEKNKALEQDMIVLKTELHLQQKLYNEILKAFTATTKNHDKGSP